MIFKKTQEILTILIDKENITFCSWAKSKKLSLHVFYQYKLQGEILDLLIFNLTQIENVIDEFLIQNKIYDTSIYLSLDSNLLDECLFNENKYQEDNINYEKICLNDQQQFYYTVGIKQVLLFQYQLLFMKLKLNLVKISADFVSLVNVHNFNDTKINYIEGLVINDFKNNIQNSINFDFEKYITNNHVMNDLDKIMLIKSIGLFINT